MLRSSQKHRFAQWGVPSTTRNWMPVGLDGKKWMLAATANAQKQEGYALVNTDTTVATKTDVYRTSS